jgi:hypothetical protein
MKFTTIVDPGIELKEIEDSLIVYWQQKGKYLDYHEVVGDGEADLVGENAVSVGGLHRSMDLFRERTFWELLRGASQPGDLFELRDGLTRLIKEGVPVHISYSRLYDVGVTPISIQTGSTKAKHGRHLKSIWTTAASWFSNTPDR